MSDERRDDEIVGRALARAIETIDLNETPYERSRIATAPVRRGFPLWQLGAAAAAILLAVALGTWFTRPTEEQPGGVAASPSASVGTSPSPAGTPSPTTTPAFTESARLYFARDGLPPVGVTIPSSNLGANVADRIGTRLSQLPVATAPAGLVNAFPKGNAVALGTSAVRVTGDLVTIDYYVPQNDWQVRGAAQTLALVQQLVYTASEEPGIRRVLVTMNAGQRATIDQFVWDKPLTREDVFGYALSATPDKIEDGGMGSLGEIADWRTSVDQVSPGLGRFVVEFKPAPGAPADSTPRFTAQLERPQAEKREEDGKWVIRVTLPDGLWNQPPGEAFHCCPLKVVGKTPIIEAAAYPLTGDAPVNGLYKGVGFALVLDDARPWRASVLQNPTRLVIDVGGTPNRVSDRIAVYSAQASPATPGCTTTCEIKVTGAARVFEANVVWRVKDSAGNVIADGHFLTSLGSSPIWGTFDTSLVLPRTFTGNATLELYEASPRDGSEQGLVQIPLTIR